MTAGEAPEPRRGVRYRKVAGFPRAELAHLLAGRLRAEGIEAIVEDLVSDDAYRGIPAFVGRGIEVLVPEDRLAEAEEIVRAIEDG